MGDPLEDEGEMEHPALVDRQFRRRPDGDHHYYIWEMRRHRAAFNLRHKLRTPQLCKVRSRTAHMRLARSPNHASHVRCQAYHPSTPVSVPKLLAIHHNLSVAFVHHPFIMHEA